MRDASRTLHARATSKGKTAVRPASPLLPRANRFQHVPLIITSPQNRPRPEIRTSEIRVKSRISLLHALTPAHHSSIPPFSPTPRPPLATGRMGRPPAPHGRCTGGVRRRAQVGASCVHEGGTSGPGRANRSRGPRPSSPPAQIALITFSGTFPSIDECFTLIFRGLEIC